MTILSISQQSLALYADEFLQGLEQSIKHWSHAQQLEERDRLAEKILRQAHRLVLLEKFLRCNESSAGKISYIENLQKVCKALVKEGAERDKLLIYFYRLFYQILRKDFTYSVLPH